MAKLPSVADHARTLMDQLTAEGKIEPDAASTAAAAAIPSFSGGTVAIDEKTGKTILPGTAVPDTTVTIAPGEIERQVATGAQSGDGKENTPAPQARTESGQFAPAAPEPGAPLAPSAAESAGTAGAEAAAAAITDAWADYEDVEYDDGDTGEKFIVRAPKTYAAKVKNGYARRSVMDRATGYAREAEPVLTQLIRDGQIRQFLPLIQRALADPAYGEYVVEGYNRAQRGQPLVQQARQEAAAAGAAQAPPPPLDPTGYGLDADPYLAQVIQPLSERLDSTARRIERYEQMEQQRQEEFTRAEQQRSFTAAQVQAGHLDLTARYPTEFSGDPVRDEKALSPVFRYAREAGYVDAYGIRAGIVMAAERLRGAREESASPAATQIARVEAEAMQLARDQARESARAVSSSGTPAAAVPKAPPRPLTTRRENGAIKSPREFATEALARSQT